MRTPFLLGATIFAAAVMALGACGDDPTDTPTDGGADGTSDGGDGGPPPTPSQYGLDSRPANTTCLAPKRPPNPSNLKLVRVFNNVSLNTPMRLTQIPGDSTRMFVALRNGSIVSFPTTNPPNTPTTVLNLASVPKTVNTNGEGGLLGIAFHPKFAQNGYVYFSYTTDGGNTGMRSVVARMKSSDNGATFAGYTDILGPFEQPYTNHDGGDAHFGKDGFLYLAFGDGGSGGDPLGNGQKTTGFFSKILRIDVDNVPNGKTYGIPTDNPFAVSGGEPATFAYGFRNPFRFSVDQETNQVWVPDVGQNAWEEVDKVQKGGNYGWNTREGKHCYSPSTNCPTNGLIDPVWDYDHSQGTAIVAATPYRGKAIPSITGQVIAADNGSGRVWILADKGDGTWTPTEITDRGGGGVWASFDVDNDGEIYGVSLAGGIYKLVPAAPEPPSTFPDKLSKTGCVDPNDPKTPASGLIPFGPVSPLWSDGAEKSRWIAVPDGTKIKLLPDGDFDFPNGTVLMKNFRIAGKLVETRLFIRHDDGGWAGYSYEWDDAQTDATLLPGSKSKVVGSQTWYYPSRAECSRCHTAAAGGSLGPETLQLNSDFVYPQTNRLSNQMRTLDHIGMFETALPAPVEQLPAMVNPTGSAALEARARSYLHANCSFCHRPTGGGGGNVDLRFATPLGNTAACGTNPQTGDLGIAGAKVIAPGNPATSILVQRPKRTDPFRMPPLGTSVVDTNGTAVLEQWVQSLSSCPGPVDAGGQ